MEGHAMSAESPRVLSIQSHVVHGHVGNKSAVFPLQVLGFDVDYINTVQFCTHTGYSHITGTVLADEEMEALMEGLTTNEVDDYTHLITGYSRSPESLKQIADIVRRLREKNPNLVYVCDPVMGDNGRMYVPEDILPVYRDVVVPLADILTPNQFEAELLTGLKMSSLEDSLRVVDKLHGMGVRTVVLSSTELGDEKNMIGIASSDGKRYKIDIPRVECSFTGTGDLFAALYLAWSQRSGGDVRAALENTIATLQTVVASTFHHAREKQPTGKLLPKHTELRLIQNKETIERPVIIIKAELL